MKQTVKVDRSKPLCDQFYEVMMRRFEAQDGVFLLGFEHWVHKTARAMEGLAREHFEGGGK